MLMVVFGAGASYDSCPSIRPPTGIVLAGSHERVANVRPPLASQLFSDRNAFARVARDFAECQPIIPFVRHAPKHSSVEQVLEEFHSEAKQKPRRAVQLAAVRHYLQFIIVECEEEWAKEHNGVTNYLTLLDEIEGWRSTQNEPVCLVTFNYDTMIEKALPSVGVKIADMHDYISHDYRLIKLHGSVNWGRAVDRVPEVTENVNQWTVARTLINSAPSLRLKNDFQIVTTRPIGMSAMGLFIPALAIPIVKKQEYECPKEHLDMLDTCIPKITKLLIVGWRGNEQHFLDRLARGLKRELQVMVVSGSAEAAEETINSLASTNMRVMGRYKKTETGFSDFIVRREAQGFLTS